MLQLVSGNCSREIVASLAFCLEGCNGSPVSFAEITV